MKVMSRSLRVDGTARNETVRILLHNNFFICLGFSVMSPLVKCVTEELNKNERPMEICI